MKIALCHSMHFAEEAKRIADELKNLGHTPYMSVDVNEYTGKNDEEKEATKLRFKYDTSILKDYFDVIAGADAILVLNYERHSILHYIGGNTLIEMGIAHYLGKKIFLMNPIPDITYYKTEIVAMKPMVIDGDLGKSTTAVRLFLFGTPLRVLYH